MIALYLLLALTLVAAGSLIYHGWRNGITPMPSSSAAARTMAEAAFVEAHRLESNGSVSSRRADFPHVIEAGSGWGTTVCALARSLPEACIVGYENSPLPFLVSRLLCRLLGFENVELKFADFRHADLTSADIVVCYLFPGGMRQLAQQIQPGEGDRRQEPSAHGSSVDVHPKLDAPSRLSAPVLISNTFSLPDRKADRCIRTGDASLSEIFVYRPPAN